ncbi:MAG: hypothetical protein ACRDLL_00105 [Solirubrobacterales bacterium]
MKGDGRDPRPMLAIFAVLVVAALGSAVSSIRLDHLLASAASLAPFALGAVAIAPRAGSTALPRHAPRAGRARHGRGDPGR